MEAMGVVMAVIIKVDMATTARPYAKDTTLMKKFVVVSDAVNLTMASAGPLLVQKIASSEKEEEEEVVMKMELMLLRVILIKNALTSVRLTVYRMIANLMCFVT